MWNGFGPTAMERMEAQIVEKLEPQIEAKYRRTGIYIRVKRDKWENIDIRYATANEIREWLDNRHPEYVVDVILEFLPHSFLSHIVH